MNVLIQPGQGFVVEALITLVLILVIHSVCDDANRSNIVTPSISIGLTIAAAHLAAVSNSYRLNLCYVFKIYICICILLEIVLSHQIIFIFLALFPNYLRSAPLVLNFYKIQSPDSHLYPPTSYHFLLYPHLFFGILFPFLLQCKFHLLLLLTLPLSLDP